jgi:Mg-chelatase subunit ChlD
LPEATPLPHQCLRDWAKNQFVGAQSRGARLARGTSDAAPGGAINWFATLLSSIPFSRISSINLRYHSVRRRPRVWCFLDASRSTGMSRCLSAARDSLIDLAVHLRLPQWNLLLLRDNQIKWVLKQSSFRSFKNVLSQLDSAGGKSYLFESLHSLHRAILKHGPTTQDRVVIVSDGLATLEAGKTYRDTPSRLRHYVRRIAWLNVSTAWLYPSTERAVTRWLQKVLRGLPVTEIKL